MSQRGTPPRERAGIVYHRFLEQARDRIGKLKINRQMSLEEAMQALASIRAHGMRHAAPDPDNGPPPTTHLACQDCHFVGRATAARCAKEPWSIISMCAPPEACSTVLCFDAQE